MTHFPHSASFSRRVSLELRNGTNTKPFRRRLPSALMQFASASSDLSWATVVRHAGSNGLQARQGCKISLSCCVSGPFLGLGFIGCLPS